MKKLFTIEKLSSTFFYIAILIYIIGFNFTDSPPPSGWYQQWMPDLNGASINDITFTDSLTGYAVTTASSSISYILRTSNGGDNWSFIRSDTGFLYKRVQFINQNTGFVGGFMYIGTSYYLLKTTNAGLSWFYINAPIDVAVSDMSALNSDTLWIADNNALVGGVYQTTNGGLNWNRQFSAGIDNPSHIYMFNARMGFIDAGSLRRTTDGGSNWTPIIGAGNFLDMYFVDSLTGWKCNQDMKKTTDGGLNWMQEVLPSGGNILLNGMIKFSNVNRDTIWGVGGNLFYGSGQFRGIIFKTTDNGQNWLFQIPDTTIHIVQYIHNKFINRLNGWAYSNSPGVHTVTGGNDTSYTGLKEISLNSPQKFRLFPNYPNPFNPVTHIRYSIGIASGQIIKSSYVKLIVYNITGKEVITLVNKKQVQGEYEEKFDGTNYSSGVYFYSLVIDGQLIDTKKMILIK